MMSKPFSGKTALVTGSTQGIGLAMARAFAAQGAKVMLNGLGDAAQIEQTRSAIERDFAVRARFHGADMTKRGEIADLVATCEREFGAVDILVNNAGIQHVAPVEEFPDDRWEAIIAINLSAVFYCTRAALPGMRKRKWGRIINISSVHGLIASPNKSAYTAAKHGVVGFTKALALEVAEHGITANAICPGYVHTELVDRQINDQAKAHGISRERAMKEIILAPQAFKEFCRIEDIAAMAVYLAGDAARSITGSAMTIDGGWTAR
jgi:3-hydroxybutyrate dehydrogenase